MLTLLLACQTGFTDPSRELGPPVSDGPQHPVEVHVPRSLGVVDTALSDIHGTPIGVDCATCHEPDASGEVWAESDSAGGPSSATELTFHRGLVLRHGDLSCASCHAPGEPGTLRLADDRRLDMADTIRLCAQCHGPKFESYRHGAHGGMNGYWDTRRGPRLRNHCVDCHAPHDPTYAQMVPTFPPGDRNPLGAGRSVDASGHEPTHTNGTADGQH